MELQVGVKILLQNAEGKYLFLLRSAEKYPETGAQWDIVGGRIDPGTGLLQNLKREIKEETGLDFTAEPKLIGVQDILSVPGRHVVRLTYTGCIDGNPTLDEDHTDFKWFTLEEVKQLENLDTYVREILEKYF